MPAKHGELLLCTTSNPKYCRACLITMVKTLVVVSVVIAIAAIVCYVIFASKLVRSSVIEIAGGKLRGFVDTSRGGKEFESFIGIPYAQPPVAELRFEPPKPALNWSNVRDAIKFGPMCTQVDNFYWKVVGEEDCLYINIYRPVDVGAKFLPVMVYFHGGYFMTGSGQNHFPHYFMDEDIIFVTFNYRLGALGFLSTQDGVIRGNNGLKDQTMALQWVQDNIRNFGGNPDMVTIFGESAGAAAVHFHMLSPMSKGLFRRAISQSGTAIKPWSMSIKPKEQAMRLGSRLNCPEEDSQSLLTCLRNTRADDITILQTETITPLLNPLHMYAATVEPPGSGNGKDIFLPDHPYIIMSTGKFHNVPWITGTNLDEGLLLTGRIALDPGLLAQLEYNWQSAIPEYLVYPPEHTNLTNSLLQFYFKKPPRSNEKLNFRENFLNLTDLITDRLYLVANREAVDHHSKKSPVFIYYYKHHGEYSFTVFFGIDPSNLYLKFAWKFISGWYYKLFGLPRTWPGVCHGDDLFVFFKVPFMVVRPGDRDYEFSRSLIKLWVQFAYDEYNMSFNGIRWEPVPPNGYAKLKYLTFGDSTEDHGIKEEEFTDRIDFWKSIKMPWIV